MILGQRRSRVVATIWALVGLGFLAAGVVLWLDARRLSFELPAAVLAFVLALAWWRQRAVLDRHGIRTVHAFREHRLLWAGIDHVEVHRPSWFRAALVVVPKGGRPPIVVPASAGLQRRQRNRMVELLTDLSRQHGFAVVMPDAAPGDDHAERGVSSTVHTVRRPAPITDVPATTEPSGADARDSNGDEPPTHEAVGSAWLALLEPIDPSPEAHPEPRPKPLERAGADEPGRITEEPVTAPSSGAEDPERDDPGLF